MGKTIHQYDQISGVDRANDELLIWDASLSATKRGTINTALGITGDPLGDDDTQTISNKTLDNSNALTIKDDNLTLQDGTSTTKQAKFQLSGITAGQTRVMTLPDYNATLASLAGTETFTNKTLTSPTINGGTIDNATITVDSIGEHTSAAGVTIDGVLLKDNKMNGSYLTDSSVGYAQLATGACVQMAYTTDGAVATGTTTIPYDDTIPQNTEGDQYMSVSITPKATSHLLVVEVAAFAANSAAVNLTGALFQDSTANALAAASNRNTAAGDPGMIVLRHIMTAGTTSSTTFKLRIGGSAAGTTTFNGSGGTRAFNTIPKSSMIIREYKA